MALATAIPHPGARVCRAAPPRRAPRRAGRVDPALGRRRDAVGAAVAGGRCRPRGPQAPPAVDSRSRAGRSADASVDPAARRGAGAFSPGLAHLLAAALVGWAGESGVLHMGGSTPDGDRAAASMSAVRIMSLLIEPAAAAVQPGRLARRRRVPGHAAHALYRFKTAFGADVLECRGARWEYGARGIFSRTTSPVAWQAAARLTRVPPVRAFFKPPQPVATGVSSDAGGGGRRPQQQRRRVERLVGHVDHGRRNPRARARARLRIGANAAVTHVPVRCASLTAPSGGGGASTANSVVPAGRRRPRAVPAC